MKRMCKCICVIIVTAFVANLYGCAGTTTTDAKSGTNTAIGTPLASYHFDENGEITYTGTQHAQHVSAQFADGGEIDNVGTYQASLVQVTFNPSNPDEPLKLTGSLASDYVAEGVSLSRSQTLSDDGQSMTFTLHVERFGASKSAIMVEMMANHLSALQPMVEAGSLTQREAWEIVGRTVEAAIGAAAGAFSPLP